MHFEFCIIVMLNFFNKIISLSFYAIFLIVPLTFAPDTSELFEFNKMWLTYGLAIIIATSWFCKMLVQKQLRIQRTVLDIPLGLFLLSQIISTIFSLDSHVSFWGYYSRFNGGLLSLITYIFLYYAFVSNVSLKQVLRYLYASIIGGVLVALWGLPSHFGYDPTCLLFRGTFDVSCWTDAFQPKVRIFSTMGQPDWLAAYLVMLTPLAFAFGAYFAKRKRMLISIFFFATTFLFYLDNLYTKARSGFIGMVVALVLLMGWYLWTKRSALRKSPLQFFKARLGSTLTIALLLVTTFFLGTGIAQLDKFTFSGLQTLFTPKPAITTVQKAKPATTPVVPTEFGGTDSGTIRLFVWEGALKIWKDHPLFGTGVETFAFAYYKYRPAGHNLTSEWDYLYNKAHNEYLNYLATTGIFGLGTYLVFIGLFLFLATKHLLKAQKIIQETRKNNKEVTVEMTLNRFILPAILAGFVSILVTNFFGFSVVTMNTYLFVLPAFFFFLQGTLPNDNVIIAPATPTAASEPSGLAWLGMTIGGIIGAYLIIVLIQYRNADVAYALGQNLDHAGEYQQAYSLLQSAVQQRPDEPVFKNEEAINESVLASALFSQHDTTNAGKLAQEAATLSTDIVTNHPNNVVFWKDRVRIMYFLSQIDPAYLTQAQIAIETAHTLAPTDAKISYNLGLIYAQSGNLDKAISTLQNTILLKADYRDAYYALGLYYHQQAAAKDGKTIIDPQKEQKAVDLMHFILAHFDPQDKQVLSSLSSWGEK